MRLPFTPVPLNAPAGTSTAKKGVLSIVTLGLQGGTRFVSNWLIGRIAGPLLLGAVASATALAFTLNTIWTSSAPSAASKFIARARGKGDEAELYAVTLFTAMRVLQVTLLLTPVAPALWMGLYGGALWEGLCISAILIAVATSQYARGVHFGAGQVARGTKIDIISSAIGLGLTLVLLLAGVRNLTLTLPLTVTMGVYALLCWPWTAHGRPEKALRSEIDKFVTFAAIGSIASAGMLQISQLVARGLSEHAGSQYAPALQLVTPLSIIASALTMVLYPSMSEAHGAGDVERLRRQTDLAFRSFVAVMVPAFGAMAIASRPLMHLVWGERYTDAWVLMPVFCLALMLQNVANPAVGSITSGPHKHMWYSLLLSQAGLVTAIGCWLFMVPWLGLFGVALGYACGAALTALSLIVVVWRMQRQRWAGLMAWVGFSAAMIAGVSWWCQNGPVNHWLDLGAAGLFGVVWLAPSARFLLRTWRQRSR